MAAPAGGALLASLHGRLERAKSVLRCLRAASKKPHMRSSADIIALVAETAGVPAITQYGTHVHRELCYMLTARRLTEMESFRLPAEYTTGVLVHVRMRRKHLHSHCLLGWRVCAAASTSTSSCTLV
jgi:hypothetical protein